MPPHLAKGLALPLAATPTLGAHQQSAHLPAGLQSAIADVRSPPKQAPVLRVKHRIQIK